MDSGWLNTQQILRSSSKGIHMGCRSCVYFTKRSERVSSEGHAIIQIPGHWRTESGCGRPRRPTLRGGGRTKGMLVNFFTPSLSALTGI